jgi:hypothetical protein
VKGVPVNYDHCGIVGATRHGATISVREDDAAVQGKGRHGRLGVMARSPLYKSVGAFVNQPTI